MSHTKRVTRDNWKNPEYHVVVATCTRQKDVNEKDNVFIFYVLFQSFPCESAISLSSVDYDWYPKKLWAQPTFMLIQMSSRAN